MKVKTIEITDYKVFLGAHKINEGGKNLFICGENGSGKSSLYYALKDFFQSFIENIDIAGLENIFVSIGKEGKAWVKVSFKPNHQGRNRKKAYAWSNAAITYRPLVLNAYSHFNTERHEIITELENAIKTVKNPMAKLAK